MADGLTFFFVSGYANRESLIAEKRQKVRRRNQKKFTTSNVPTAVVTTEDDQSAINSGTGPMVFLIEDGDGNNKNVLRR